MKYYIYGIMYKELAGKRVNAVCSAESHEEAKSILEKALKDKGREDDWIKEMNPLITETEFKTSKKGIIFGYDFRFGYL